METIYVNDKLKQQFQETALGKYEDKSAMDDLSALNLSDTRSRDNSRHFKSNNSGAFGMRRNLDNSTSQLSSFGA